jgi:hypothetical protein
MTATTRSNEMPEGEIALIDADRLEDHAGAAARNTTNSVFGDRDDDRALGRMIAQLKRTPAGARTSDEDLQDKAIDLYNKICDNIRRRTATPEQVAQAAQLFGESPEHLQERLDPRPQAEDGGGAGGLMAALRS